ncbi:MAG: c-type cytochrome [Saprospiraceae bacterium]|nr:c-type cytochrome [Saprospiraceae bacterium]
MKRSFAYTLVALTGMFFFFAFTLDQGTSSTEMAMGKFKIPKKVNAIIQDKCYGCHNPNAKGDKSKAKLDWDALAGLSMADQAMKVKDIAKVLADGSMPPKMMTDRNPDKKLTDAETATMSKWANKMVKKLSK